MSNPISETDLVKIAEREVVEAAKALAQRMNATRFMFNAEESQFLRTVTLLTAREAMAATGPFGR